MNNRICEILGIEKPIIQGPMSWLTNAEFVAAVSNAGGLGFLAATAGQVDRTPNRSPELTAERLRTEIQKTKTLTEKPFGTVIIGGSDLNYMWRMIETVIEEKVPVVLVNGLPGLPYEKIFKPLKDNNIKIVYRPLTPTIKDAKAAEALGIDIYVATGFDEGGTVPERVIGTFSIVPMIADAINIPVMAAGGIGDVRGVRAAFALGAEGVFAGSVFIPTKENPAAENVKQMIVDATAEDLLMFRTLPAYYRSLPTKLANKLVEMDNQGASREETSKFLFDGMRIGMLEGNTDDGYISVGTGITPIKEIITVKEVVDNLMQDFN
ncbi:NAD(P)H-dependent flavin oxidoreductase YrpB (nitropropane dioxygenase family) [Paenibacillus sp. SORGH_AS306]|uniref:Probable nitronate monooxygenase n=1 Tax=Paenibacillus kyungheensis TaxID=1452732 RepID=A0AAX3LV89_9BACL|nr:MULTISPECIES: nitronate monooxygenase [Paenibacillus]MDQ1234154.1 NAD(P)H-dependent flavin oxidoreductase YrpB (nitropropane dioxygenase family) [Paenibacillus sp. SORGH_AS_0306]WCT53786.1 nitronate monooxygenase [Paenibacillus kyungheensis]